MKAVQREVEGGLFCRASPSPIVHIHSSLKEEDKQRGISGNTNRLKQDNVVYVLPISPFDIQGDS